MKAEQKQEAITIYNKLSDARYKMYEPIHQADEKAIFDIMKVIEELGEECKKYRDKY